MFSTTSPLGTVSIVWPEGRLGFWVWTLQPVILKTGVADARVASNRTKDNLANMLRKDDGDEGSWKGGD